VKTGDNFFYFAGVVILTLRGVTIVTAVIDLAMPLLEVPEGLILHLHHFTLLLEDILDLPSTVLLKGL